MSLPVWRAGMEEVFKESGSSDASKMTSSSMFAFTDKKRTEMKNILNVSDFAIGLCDCFDDLEVVDDYKFISWSEMLWCSAVVNVKETVYLNLER